MGLEWDTLLPNEITEDWLSSRDSLKQLENHQIPRCVLPDKKFENFQLHFFTDASEKTYVATVYSRFQSSDGSISVQLLVAKTRVAPVKVVSLPRLELCGAQLGTRLIKTVIESLQSLTITIDSVPAWTDSTIVLKWLNQLPRTWATFVANRVSEIQDFLPRNKWNHVPSQNNPADLSSRGADVRDLLQSKLWWNGQDFLNSSEAEWPLQPQLSSTPPESRFKQSVEANCASNLSTSTESTELWDTERFSSFTKLLRVIAFVQISIQLIKRQDRSKHISATDLQIAKNYVIRSHQRFFFRKK